MQVRDLMNQSVVSIDPSESAALAARLSGAVLCLCHAETVGDSLEAALSSLPPIMETVFVLSREPVNLSGLSSRFILVEFSLEGTNQVREIFEQYEITESGEDAGNHMTFYRHR